MKINFNTGLILVGGIAIGAVTSQGFPEKLCRVLLLVRGESCIAYSCASPSCCLRHPYRVMPGGLYTESTAATSNTSRPPAEWTTS
jgi:hypothetical protein